MKDSAQLFLIASMLFGLTAWANPSYDPDLGWHLFGGAWIAAHGELPIADSINAFRSTWHDYHWLAQIALYQGYSLGGLTALRILVGLMGALLAVILYMTAERIGEKTPNALRSFLVTLVGMSLIRPYLLPRPQIFSFVLIAIVVYVIFTCKRRVAFAAVLLCALLCVQIHINWILIPMLWLVIWAVGVPLSKRNLCRTSFEAAMLFAVGFCDPYAVLLQDPLIMFKLVAQYSMMSASLRAEIGEMRSLAGISFAEIIPVLLLALLGIGSLRRSASPRDYRPTVLAVVGCVLICSMLKFIPIFAILMLPAAVIGFVTIEAAFPQILRAVTRPLSMFASIISVLTLVTLVVVGSPFLYNSNRSLFTYLPKELCQEVSHLAETHALIDRPLRVLTHFNEGGWCRWFAHELNPLADVRVTTDGRTQDYSYDLLSKSFQVYELRNGWEEALRDLSVDLAVVPKSQLLAQQLMHQQDWQQVAESRFHYLFKHVSR